MLRCDRCESIWSPMRVSRSKICPRCRARDRVSIPLVFAPFTAEPPEVDDATAGEQATLEEAEEEEGMAQA